MLKWICCITSSAEDQHEHSESPRPRRSSLRPAPEDRSMDQTQSQGDKMLRYVSDTGSPVTSQPLAKARKEIRKGTGFVFKTDLPLADSDEEEGAG
mmetsp:Transcript_73715/g.159522  ORF Transcript_73715/g.159522 Transcript_73715/m.159522 type:complete len:96 (+) Transcript_73715:68-355(+)